MTQRLNGIASIAVGLLAVVGFFIILYRVNQFKKNYRFADGVITDVTTPGWRSSGDYSVLYERRINNKTYRNNNNYFYCKGWNLPKLKLLLVGKHFPVAYSVNNVGLGTMLITRKNAELFKYHLTDSIKIYDSILSCK